MPSAVMGSRVPASRAQPKSPSFTWPSAEYIRLPGFKSRWMKPFWCKAVSAPARSQPVRRISASARPPPAESAPLILEAVAAAGPGAARGSCRACPSASPKSSGATRWGWESLPRTPRHARPARSDVALSCPHAAAATGAGRPRRDRAVGALLPGLVDDAHAAATQASRQAIRPDLGQRNRQRRLGWLGWLRASAVVRIAHRKIIAFITTPSATKLERDRSLRCRSRALSAGSATRADPTSPGASSSRLTSYGRPSAWRSRRGSRARPRPPMRRSCRGGRGLRRGGCGRRPCLGAAFNRVRGLFRLPPGPHAAVFQQR